MRPADLSGTSLPHLHRATLVSFNVLRGFHRGVHSTFSGHLLLVNSFSVVLLRNLLRDLLRDFLLDFSWGVNVSGSAAARSSAFATVSAVSHTTTPARQQPHLNNLEPHRSATMLRTFLCRPCSCGVWRLCESPGLPTAPRLLVALVCRGY